MTRKLNNSYYNQYMKKRYAKKRIAAIEFLGGKCVSCGSIENLEFDHIDKNTKTYSIADVFLWSKDKMIEELKKCQLLCKKCHTEKSILESGKIIVKGKNVHGTLSSYRYCKCDICKSFKSTYTKEYKKRKLTLDKNNKVV